MWLDMGDDDSYIPLQPCWLDQTGTRCPLIRVAAPGGLIEAFEEVLDLGVSEGLHRRLTADPILTHP